MNEDFLSNSKQKEYILCAAIHYQDGKEYPHQPKNVKSGIVACGRRHHNCITTLAFLLGDKYDVHFIAKGDGFLTSKDRFVSRKEGAKIAYKAGQIDKEQRTMFSEDLY